MKLNKIQFLVTPLDKDQFKMQLLKNNNCARPLYEDVTAGYFGVLIQRIFKYLDNVKSVKITITYK